MHRLSCVVLAAACCVPAALVTAADSPPTATRYQVTILSNAGASGNSIDDLGLVTGFYTLASGAQHASAWFFGQQRDLGTLGSGAGLSSIVQWPVKNVLGLVSGISLTDKLDPNQEIWSCGYFINNPSSNQCLGFVWDPIDRKMRPLPTLGGTNGFATGTNDLGLTVGWAENTVHDSSCVSPQVLQFKPVVWGPGRDEIHALPLPDGETSGAATAINDRGQIVGIAGICGFAVGGPTALHAVLWDNGVMTVLQNPNNAPYWNTPMMVNGRGDVVGFAGVPGDAAGNFTPPFMWTRDGGWAFIPMLSGDIAGAATSINERRQIVGYSNDAANPPNFHPWIYQNGVLTNLNDLIEPGSGLTGPLKLAFDINDEGVITGTTTTGQAFVAIPVGSGNQNGQHQNDQR
jgi:probable HAF family extracellular repeat protein